MSFVLINPFLFSVFCILSKECWPLSDMFCVLANVFRVSDFVFQYKLFDNFYALWQWVQLELSASNTVKVDYRLPVTCSDFNSTTVNSLGLDFIDLLPVTLSISYRCLNVVSNTNFNAICSHYYHFSNRIATNIILL